MSLFGRCQECGRGIEYGDGYMLATPMIGRADSEFAGEVVGYAHQYFHNVCPPPPPVLDPSKRKVQGAR